MQTTIFSAPDIVCDGCANAIKKALGALPGVGSISVDIATKQVIVSHEPGVTRETLIQALDRAGFSVAA